jgi:hypothetical protein
VYYDRLKKENAAMQVSVFRTRKNLADSSLLSARQSNLNGLFARSHMTAIAHGNQGYKCLTVTSTRRYLFMK